MRRILTLLLVPAMLALAACNSGGPAGSAASGSLPSLNPLLTEAMPAVVNVQVRGTVRPSAEMLRDPDIRRYFGGEKEKPFRSVGSGVIVNAAKGLVITSAHVVENATEIGVTLGDGNEVPAQVVGSAADIDIAVLRIPANGLKTELPVDDTDMPKVGDFVVAIGNPFGLGQTASLGIVSATGRSGLGIEGYEDFIQTDAAINPGSSGGALINLDGHLVGINTAIISPSGANAGIGFAIPMHMVKNSIDQIEQYGSVSRARLGVAIEDLTPAKAASRGISVNRGALITGIVPGTVAASAGLRVGDVVTGLDGHPIDGATALRNAVGLMRPQTSVLLTVVRGKETLSLPVALGAQ
ncbi:trypsin-like peptidase domain-containing protein [Inquilinus sp. Marseille-Q2685]|uniref:trypsin-like peptidase domain-containing protein n=1 Tax=Inquilinus sp. Marseille-Q2685 TaxID=2866581 RepID=UPI001CE3B865|nr:trypsin-like peptidase domain-containing protein [Inquilinus sp. Marseille-Q2685]